MEHKVNYRTPEGMLRETLFNNFEEFADHIEGVAQQYYQGMQSDIEVETIYDDGLIKKERVTNATTNMESREGAGIQYLEETGPTNEGKA